MSLIIAAGLLVVAAVQFVIVRRTNQSLAALEGQLRDLERRIHSSGRTA